MGCQNFGHGTFVTWNSHHTILRCRQLDSRVFRVLFRAYFLINSNVGRQGGKLTGRCGRVYGVRCWERSGVLEEVWKKVWESVLGCKGRYGNGCREMR